MKRNVSRLAGALCALLPLSAAAADEGTHFHIKPILILGDDDVQATSINNKGTIAATVYAGITFAPSGITIRGNTVTTLPVPDASHSAFYPRVINDSGDIFGWARGSVEGNAQSFLLHDGAYIQTYEEPLIEPGQNSAYILPAPMGLTASGEIFFNTIYSLSGPVGTNYGTPPKFRHIPPMNRFTVIQSINNAGTVAGTSFSFGGIRTMYAGSGKKFKSILPPNSVSTLGGFLNNNGAVAGSYIDTSHTYHGFVYQSGAYTSFDMPEPAASISVTGINDNGRVVGAYIATSNGKQHAFLYNGTTVSTFGAYNSSDNISIALNNQGAMVLSRQLYDAAYPVYQSFRITCSGTGC